MYSHPSIHRSEPSILVESMHNITNKEHIEKTFQHLGKIAKVEFNYCGSFKQATVHFKFWYENSDANSARVVLLRNKDLIVMHDYDKYWMTSSALTRNAIFKQECQINTNYVLNTLEMVEKEEAALQKNQVVV
jgi:hypothetical protein